jgi:hypothetical protein
VLGKQRYLRYSGNHHLSQPYHGRSYYPPNVLPSNIYGSTAIVSAGLGEAVVAQVERIEMRYKIR